MRAAPRHLTTAIGFFKQNSCRRGLKASFLFSNITDGVDGSNCSRVNCWGGGSGGVGGGPFGDNTFLFHIPVPVSFLKLIFNNEYNN